MNKKILYVLFAVSTCFLLIGCGKNSKDNEIEENLTSANLLSCTNLSRHIVLQRNDVVESWKYVIEYDENDQNILSWKEIYKADFGNIEDATHDKIVELIESSFCKGRLNDVTEEGYEKNRDYCQITNEGAVYTAIVTYPDKSIKHFVENSESGFNKTTLKTQLEDGTYDGGFRGIYTCDKDFDHFAIKGYNMERDIQVKYLGGYEYGKEDALIFLGSMLENGTYAIDGAFNYKQWLKEYKIDGTNSIEAILKSEDGDDKYTYTIKFTCYSNSQNDCEAYMNAILDKIKQNQSDNLYQVIK